MFLVMVFCEVHPSLLLFIVGLLDSDDLGVPNLLKCNGAHALVPDL